MEQERAFRGEKLYAGRNEGALVKGATGITLRHYTHGSACIVPEACSAIARC